MKRIITTLCAMALIAFGSTSMAASDKQIREEARFLADKIAHEMDLDKNQLNDAFEINYDFLKAVHPLLEAIEQGDNKAITRYYVLLDIRNSELVWILDHDKFTRYFDIEYLYRPLYLKEGKAQLRAYDTYGKKKFYKGKPKSMSRYKGEHDRNKLESSYYKGRYRQIAFGGQPRLLHDVHKEKMKFYRKADFGK
ncbi:hypothetical protein LJB80_01000 [Bacteroides sp. OttesenSCG-928-F21]|nr:hypothetical protein [Bacteroides sp. OttesenSCG-928-F21]